MTRILFHAVNGVGLGHVARLAWIARALQAAHPSARCRVITTSAHAERYFGAPCERIPCDLLEPEAHGALLGRHLEAWRPEIVVCDTRWPKELPGWIGRLGLRAVLVLRALTADRMERSLAEATSSFARILLPHAPDELASYYAPRPALLARLGRAPLLAVGPLARVSDVRSPDAAILFSMGAGGEYLGNVQPPNDVRSHLAAYAEAARRLHARGHRELRLVAGPLLAVPDDLGPLEVVRTLDAHALVGPRSVVIGRGGYNTSWEAIAAGAHLVLCSSHAVVEDVHARCRYLAAQGFARHAGVEPSEIVEAVLGGPAPRVEAGGRAVNAGLGEAVAAILG